MSESKVIQVEQIRRQKYSEFKELMDNEQFTADDAQRPTTLEMGQYH